jgi:MFS family permease
LDLDSKTENSSEQKAVTREVQLTFRSLKHRNFRIYFCGQAVSLCGTWMQQLALSWLVYRMTNSAWILGVVEFALLSPVLFIGLAGGWVADHVSRKKVLAIAQLAALAQATILSILALSGQIQVWQIICLAAAAGIINAFEIPSRQALIVQMVDRKDLVNAISLNSSLFNGSRIIGPAMAAALIGFKGEAICFVINALSYLASFTAVMLLKVPVDAHKHEKGSRSVLEGIKYCFSTPNVRQILLLTAALSVFGGQFTVLLPVMAKQILHTDVEGFGALRSAAAVGSLMAALLLANRGSGDMLNRGVGFANLAFGVFLAAFAISQNFFLSIAIACFLGFFMTFQLSGSHSMLQLQVPDEMRGRLMSVWTMMIMGISPLGSLMVGWLANHYGAPFALVLCSSVSVLAAVIYLIVRKSNKDGRRTTSGITSPPG